MDIPQDLEIQVTWDFHCTLICCCKDLARRQILDYHTASGVSLGSVPVEVQKTDLEGSKMAAEVRRTKALGISSKV